MRDGAIYIEREGGLFVLYKAFDDASFKKNSDISSCFFYVR